MTSARRTVLTTRRLVLTTWTAADAADLHTVHSDPETMRFVRSRRPETLRQTEELVAAYVEEQDTRGWTKWRLADRQDRLVGRAGFGAAVDGRELGYTIRRDLWGHGMATEIARALVDRHLADRDSGYRGELSAYVVVGNGPSARVLEKVGFAYIDTREYRGGPCLYFRLGL